MKHGVICGLAMAVAAGLAVPAMATVTQFAVHRATPGEDSLDLLSTKGAAPTMTVAGDAVANAGPEVGTWGIMLAGFGGLSGRRSRRPGKPAVA